MNGGKHLIIDLYNCENMPSQEVVYDVLSELPEMVNMTALTKPYVLKGAPYNPGWTGVTIIETSHISIHTFSDEKHIAFDLYSCRNFDEGRVTSYILKTFKPGTQKVQVCKRV